MVTAHLVLALDQAVELLEELGIEKAKRATFQRAAKTFRAETCTLRVE